MVNPTITSAEFMETVLLGFGIREIPASKPQRLALLEKHLLQTQMEGKIAALIVDEAHKLSTDALEEIRLLGNLERRSEKLLQIMLAGQPELAATMNRDRLRAIEATRITAGDAAAIGSGGRRPVYRLQVGAGRRAAARAVLATGRGTDGARITRHSPPDQRDLR